MSRVAVTDWTERLAIGASAACLAHCLLLPLIFAALPVVSASLAVPESFHLWVLAVAVPCAGIALWQGRLRHGATWPLVAGAAGLAALTVGALVAGETAWELPVTVVGSLMLAGAHLANWRLRHGRCC